MPSVALSRAIKDLGGFMRLSCFYLKISKIIEIGLVHPFLLFYPL